jgi:dolichyl-phosphate-mannose-protein mannosyltransferase
LRPDARRWLPALALVALAFVAFLPAVWSSFVSDDFLLVHNLRQAGGVTWPFSRNDAGEAGAAGHFYRPVWMLWNLGIFKAFGASAVAFHLANLLLYAVVVLEVWLLAARLSDRRRAWIAAAAFAVYPRHGESVAWVSGSTDLAAVAVVLATLLWGFSRLPLPARLAGAVALTGVATLTKEIAFVLPLLALLLVRRRRDLAVPGAMLAAEAATFALRWVEIGGFGGYSGYAWTPLRVLGVAASYCVAALTPPSVMTFRYPVVLALPVLLVAAAAWRLRRRPRGLVWLGLGWFGVSILPLLNLAVDLNNTNGERLMLLASVGLALAVAGLLNPGGQTLGLSPLVAAGLALGLGLSLYSSFDWIRAGRISSRVVAQAERLAPSGGELVVLAAPESYRTAHIFTGGDLSPAFSDRRPDVLTAICTHVIVRHERRGAIRFSAGAPPYRGEATWDAPFDFPVLRRSTAITGDCAYSRPPGGERAPGLGLLVDTTPLPRVPGRAVYYDGRDLIACC